MILLVGAGYMAREYAKVLTSLECDFQVVGRGEENAAIFEQEFSRPVIRGGLENFIKTMKQAPSHVVVATHVQSLSDNAMLLLNNGVKNLLIEKPGFLGIEEGVSLQKAAEAQDAKVFIAYNRRYFASVLAAKKIIEKEGLESFSFDFTEWSHTISDDAYDKMVLENWVLSNSSHVIDMAFFLGGHPKSLHSETSGELSWHPSASKFVGSGMSEKNALFSYIADWKSPGRWGIEVMTPDSKLIFRPLEKLQVQKKGSVAIEMVENIDYGNDEKFKPGLRLMVEDFISSKLDSNLCKLDDQVRSLKTYQEIAGYLK